MNDIIYLISVLACSDEIGNQLEDGNERMTYCELANITQNEFYNARQRDLKIKYCVEVNTFDYYGEVYAKYRNEKYTIVRTYSKGDKTELYLAEY